MPRHQRILSETGTYHVMMRGNERKNLFLNENDKQRFLETLFMKKEETGFHLYAYCLMDNHVHLVIQAEQESLATTMKRVNASYASYFNQQHQRVGHLFQDRFKSEPIEDEQYLMSVIRYIHNNPVKAGMVEKPDQYRWSSFKSYLAPNKTRNVDAAFVLSIISDNQQEAIDEFIRFSQGTDQNDFLDMNENIPLTMQEGKQFLHEYLKETWSEYSLEELVKNPETRNEVIAYLRANTRLSIRKIADLLGVTRGSVQYIKPKQI